MQSLSNELKAIAVMADISDSGTTVTRDQCVTVEQFQYRCERKRDSYGHTYGANEPVELTFCVRINAADQAQPFYRQLTEVDFDTLSFLFNATFSDTKRLSGYDEALAVEGYIVDVQEVFHSAALSAQDEEQILLRARMQVRSIVYTGQDDKKTLCFIHD